MFFPERVKSIRATDQVLEIGPGAHPHPRSNVLLEKVFENKEEEEAQRGYAKALATDKKVVFYEGGAFPFKDKEFDYVICSHVLEHVPAGDLPLFFAEMQRVASKGYIEFPTIFYELINYQDVHLWLMNYRDQVIYFLDKSLFRSNNIHRVYREMFYGRDKCFFDSFSMYKELYFAGFEWKDKLNFKMIEDFDFLVNDSDLNKFKLYFSSQRNKRPLLLDKMVSFTSKCVNHALQRFKFRRGYFVHRTANLNNKNLITIKNRAEINEYVIIKTQENPVVIGEYTQINPFTVIYGGSGVYIGNNVMIAPHCMFAAGDHDFKQIDVPIRFAGNLSRGPITIEDNVWIGANCTITDGVTIGKDSVIAANSVVTKDVSPYDIVGGSPARTIANRKNLVR